MTEKLNGAMQVLSSIQKGLKAPKELRNNFGNFAYRNAEGILHALKDEIAKDIYPDTTAIVTDFDIVLIGQRTFMKCEASLKVGSETINANAFAELDLTKKGMDQAQLTGAATSYAKKYALCNLFAIDDSKDDPDADEKNAIQKDKPKKNAFGLSSEGELANGDDMKQMFEEQAAKNFILIKKDLEACESLEEVEKVSKKWKKEINGFAKYDKDRFDLLKECKATMIDELTPDELDDNLSM
jgi:hypothetical protein